MEIVEWSILIKFISEISFTFCWVKFIRFLIIQAYFQFFLLILCVLNYKLTYLYIILALHDLLVWMFNILWLAEKCLLNYFWFLFCNNFLLILVISLEWTSVPHYNRRFTCNRQVILFILSVPVDLFIFSEQPIILFWILALFFSLYLFLKAFILNNIFMI